MNIVKAAAALGAAALIAGMGTVSAHAAVTPKACVENYATPAYSSAEYVTNSGSVPMWSGVGDACVQVGLLNPGDVFDANCGHADPAGQEWVYGEDTTTGTFGWIYRPNVVKVGGDLYGCANWLLPDAS